MPTRDDTSAVAHPLTPARSPQSARTVPGPAARKPRDLLKLGLAKLGLPKRGLAKLGFVSLGFVSLGLAPLVLATPASANEVRSSTPRVADPAAGDESFQFDASGPESARFEQRLDRVLNDANMLPSTLRGLVTSSGGDQEALGDGGIPFSTKRVAAPGTQIPTDYFPWRATGKSVMLMPDGGTTVCSASVIGPSMLVTAAHCIHSYGQQDAGFIADYKFAPAFHEGHAPYGIWRGKEWYLAEAYYDGDDNCVVRGVVCENDVAVIVMEPKEGKLIGDVVGQYRVLTYSDGLDEEDFSLATVGGKQMLQITQLGYPALFYDGDKMIRTDSLGFRDTPNNVAVGSNQTGGSSGGPWLLNFGVDTSFSGDAEPNDNVSNVVVATTSWGYRGASAGNMIQGASRFAKNSVFTVKSNVATLIEAACDDYPWACSDD